MALSRLWPDAIAELQKKYDCKVVLDPDSETRDRALRVAEVVLLRSPVVLDRSAIEAAARLRLIVRAGTGTESIDIACARERGIRIETVPLSADSVAEHTLGLILSLARRITWHHQMLQQGHWTKHDGYGQELFGKTIALVGFGRIGRSIAALTTVFRMKVLAVDRSPHAPEKVSAAAKFDTEFVSIEDAFSRADIVSAQVPLNERTRGLIGETLIRRLTRAALLVNVGRGGVVDEGALLEALQSGQLGGAALDVFATEPPGDHPLLSLPNFIATPHIGAQTKEAQKRVGDDVVKIVDAFAATL